MNNFIDLNDNEMLEIDGGLVICGIVITAALVIKATVVVIAVGGVVSCALGAYNGFNTTRN